MTASDVKICWFCYSGENGDNPDAWVNPCKCKGSVKWCHQACLRPWIQYKIDNIHAVQCDICRYRYKIHIPPPNAKPNVYYYLCFAWVVFFSTTWVCLPPKIILVWGGLKVLLVVPPVENWVMGCMFMICSGPSITKQYKLFSTCMDLAIGRSYMVVLPWSVVVLLVSHTITCFWGAAGEKWVRDRELTKKQQSMEIRAYEGC